MTYYLFFDLIILTFLGGLMSPKDLGNSDVSRPSPRGRELPGVAFRSDMVKGVKKRRVPKVRKFRIYCCGGYRVGEGEEKICPKCGKSRLF